MKAIFTICLSALLLAVSFNSLEAAFKFPEFQFKGKVDAGPTFVKIDVLESGKTVDKLYLTCVKADAVLMITKGIAIKPGFILGTGHDGRLATFTIGVGHGLPIGERLILMPSVGVAWTYLRTKIDIELPFIGSERFKEKFHSTSPFVSLEFSYRLTEKLYMHGMYQYAWSRTHTVIKPLVSDKSHSCGPNYALGLDYSLTPNWSITAGAGYNITLSKEKHGLRGMGARLGAAYYF